MKTPLELNKQRVFLRASFIIFFLFVYCQRIEELLAGNLKNESFPFVGIASSSMGRYRNLIHDNELVTNNRKKIPTFNKPRVLEDIED